MVHYNVAITMCQDSSMVRFLRIDPMVNDSSPASLSGKILVH